MGCGSSTQATTSENVDDPTNENPSAPNEEENKDATSSAENPTYTEEITPNKSLETFIINEEEKDNHNETNNDDDSKDQTTQSLPLDKQPLPPIKADEKEIISNDEFFGRPKTSNPALRLPRSLPRLTNNKVLPVLNDAPEVEPLREEDELEIRDENESNNQETLKNHQIEKINNANEIREVEIIDVKSELKIDDNRDVILTPFVSRTPSEKSVQNPASDDNVKETSSNGDKSVRIAEGHMVIESPSEGQQQDDSGTEVEDDGGQPNMPNNTSPENRDESWQNNNGQAVLASTTQIQDQIDEGIQLEKEVGSSTIILESTTIINNTMSSTITPTNPSITSSSVEVNA